MNRVDHRPLPHAAITAQDLYGRSVDEFAQRLVNRYDTNNNGAIDYFFKDEGSVSVRGGAGGVGLMSWADGHDPRNGLYGNENGRVGPKELANAISDGLRVEGSPRGDDALNVSQSEKLAKLLHEKSR